MKYTTLPAITGKQLIALLQKDGWIIQRKAKHGKSLVKQIEDRKLTTIVQNTASPLCIGTLMDILGSRQTRLGKKGLLELLNKYGL